MAQPTPTKERKLFFTTTDLIERLNSTVAEVSGEDAPANPKNNVGCQPQSQQRGFELQRRMPDGSSRKADEGDRAVTENCLFLVNNLRGFVCSNSHRSVALSRE